jgi:hypothetical protein
MRIVIAGGTGFLGAALVPRLRRAGHDVTVLARHPRRPGERAWTPGGSSDGLAHVLDGADAVINLAGAPIAQRWTKAHKRELWDSRVPLTRMIVEAMRSAPRAPGTLVNGSAIGIYGSRGDESLTEDSPHGTGFLASLGTAWEREALAAEPFTRVVLLRTGIVLGRDGGALPQMALPFRFFVGGPLGSGRQYLSWIHLEDWMTMAVRALTDAAVSGPLNVTAPNPVTNRDFARTLGRILRRPALLPAPAFALRAVLGEMADAIVTGQRVLPAKALRLGFRFQYPEVDAALRDALTRTPQRT